MVVDRRFRRDGDQFALPLAFVYSHPSRRWAIGPGVDFLFRSMQEKLSWEFRTTGYPGTTVQTAENVSGAAPTIAFSLSPNSSASLGFIYRHRATLKGDLEVKQEAGTVSRTRSSLRYPARAAAGLSWNTPSLLLVGDVAWENWSDTRSRPGNMPSVSSSRVDDALAWSLGIEAGGHDRRIPILGRRPFRAGFRRDTLPETSFGDGSRLHQELLSIGTGWTLSGGLATLDLSLEAGRRGSLEHQGARERVFQIGISMSGREPWKRPDRHGGWSPPEPTTPEGTGY